MFSCITNIPFIPRYIRIYEYDMYLYHCNQIRKQFKSHEVAWSCHWSPNYSMTCYYVVYDDLYRVIVIPRYKNDGESIVSVYSDLPYTIYIHVLYTYKHSFTNSFKVVNKHIKTSTTTNSVDSIIKICSNN